MADIEAMVREILDMVLPSCTPESIEEYLKDRKVNPDPHVRESDLAGSLAWTASAVWNHVNPERRAVEMRIAQEDGIPYEHLLVSNFRRYVVNLMELRHLTLEEAVRQATEVVREAVRRYYDGTFDDWYRELNERSLSLGRQVIARARERRTTGSGAVEGTGIPFGPGQTS